MRPIRKIYTHRAYDGGDRDRVRDIVDDARQQ